MRFRHVALAFLSALSFSATAQITVTSTADVEADDGQCTLREAILAANADTASGVSARECAAGDGADLILLDVAPGSTIALISELPSVVESATIEGPTPEASGVTLDAGGQFRVLQFANPSASAAYVLRGVTLTGGEATFGGGLHVDGAVTCEIDHVVFVGNHASNSGGGLLIGRDAACDIDRVTIMGNTSDASGGGLHAGQSSIVTLRNSTIVGNTAATTGGGVFVFFNIGTEGSHTIEQSTVSGNTSGRFGGGVYATGPQGTVTIRASTIVGNQSVGASAGTGGAFLNGTAFVESSIFAGNTSDASGPFNQDLGASSTTTSGGGNLIGVGQNNTAFPVGLPNDNGDLVGSQFALLDPMLEPLADNGGATQTHLPAEGSPVVDAGICTSAATDQRGGPREVDITSVSDANGDACDIGAVESAAVVVASEPLATQALRLDAPTPNPARGDVQIAFQIAASGEVALTVVDLLGREVAVLARGLREAGEHSATFDTRPLAPGVYSIQLVTPEAIAVQRVTVVR